jgi:hypothetical protein
MGAPGTEERDRVRVNGSDETEKTPPAHVRNRPTRGRRQKDTHSRLIKASFNLPAEDLEALKSLADRRQTSATQVLRDALRTELYIQRLVDRGESFFAKVGRRGREIVFSHMV